MLVNLHVKNLALIEEENIDFNEGLNILTGETGAGKSIILGSINAALGAKTSPEFIRTGCEYGLAEVTFFVEDEKTRNALKEYGILDIDDGELVISRKISQNRSTIKINGQSFTSSQTRQLANLLINIHGQRDNQILIDESNQLALVDEYVKEEAIEISSKLKESFKRFKEAKKALEELNINEEERNRQISFLEYEINEISSANLRPKEDTKIEAEYNKMKNYQKIVSELSFVSEALYEGEGNVSDLISEIIRHTNKALEYDEGLTDTANTLNSIEDLITDVNHQVSNYMSDLEFDEERFNELENRLDLINNLKMKYGKSIEDILENLSAKEKKLEEYLDFDNVYNNNKKELAKIEDECLNLAKQLSNIRKLAAKKLEKAFIIALKELNFLDVKFEIEFSQANLSQLGIDKLCFMISTNPGEDLKPLSKVASGGELSRIMLALKSIMASKNDQTSYIFDEIDTGISGKTASMVATKLSALSKSNQIICITHLPQIAAMASKHFIIEKSLSNNRTISNIKALTEEESINELARLLGDGSMTDATILNAKELKSRSKNLILS